MLMPRNYRPAVSAGTLDPRLPIKIRGGAGGGERMQGGRQARPNTVAFASCDIAHKHPLSRVASSHRDHRECRLEKRSRRVQREKKIRVDVAD